jgi:hypothetical protein
VFSDDENVVHNDSAEFRSMTTLTRSLLTTRPMLIVSLLLSMSKHVTGPTIMKPVCFPTKISTVLAIVSSMTCKETVLLDLSCIVAGRTILYTILSSLERIAFNGDPLQFMLVETTYQSFVSLLRQTGITKEHPEISGIRRWQSSSCVIWSSIV